MLEDRVHDMSRDQLAEMLRKMCLIRAFDSRLPALYTQGHIRGSSHAAIGQEAVAVGACAALESTDYITSTHRGHGHAIAKGADVRKMMAEIFGRVDGYCKGKGGSMHIADFSIGMLGANGIVGGGIGIATGVALSTVLRGGDEVVLCFFGDGAVNQGTFLESANLAGIWQLPVVYVCENNHFAMSARAEEMIAGEISARGTALGFPAKVVDGMDVIAVHAAVGAAIDHARGRQGPSLVVANCYRFEGHFSGDTMAYRSAEEAAPWLERDPLALYEAHLIEAGVIDQQEAASIRAAASEAIDEAVRFAHQSPLPDPAEAWRDVCD
jgi:pyruvate dehydrogenase E1 component alpha subunit